MLLADMGADVIKVEQPGKGDDTRGYGPPFLNGESAYFMSINRNKRSMTLNLKHKDGLNILRGLVERADVLVENFRPGKMEDFGFGYDTVKEMNPRLVYCSISGYGHTGPWASHPGYDLIVQGEGGIQSLTGEPEGPPNKVGTSQADIIAGMNGFQGILLGLLSRNQTGRGQKIDISMLDCQVALLTYQAGIYFATGESPTRMGNKHPPIAPYETFLCKDGYINLGCGNDRIWRLFCQIVGLSNLVEDPQFQSNPERVKNRAKLHSILAPVFLEKTSQEWVNLLRPQGIPCGHIQSVGEICEHPQVKQREMVVEMDHEKAGSIKVTGIPIKMSETPGAIHAPPPLIGEHTRDILSEWLGMETKEINRLYEVHVL
jgi:crotonobetainyl-CoA:carnitine CoA-transferase CaiB-like acyl-CoA transferase